MSHDKEVSDCPNCECSDTHLYRWGTAEWWAGCPACGLNGPIVDTQEEAADMFEQITVE